MSPPYQQLLSDDNPFDLQPPESGMVCATQPRNCSLDSTIMRITKEYNTHFIIPHSNVVSYMTGELVYMLGVDAGIPKDIKFVCDGSTGEPVIQFKGPSFTWLRSRFHMRAADNPSKPVVASCNMKVGGSKVKLEVEFQDKLLPGVRHQIFLRGSRWTRDFDVLLGDKRNGRKVAKIFQPVGRVGGARHTDHYHIHIAPGVDMVLILAMLLAVEAYLGAW